MKFLSNSKLDRNIAIYNEFVDLNKNTKPGEKKRGWTFLSRKYKISPERVRMILTQLNNRIEAGDLQLNDDFKIIKFKQPRELI